MDCPQLSDSSTRLDPSKCLEHATEVPDVLRQSATMAFEGLIVPGHLIQVTLNWWFGLVVPLFRVEGKMVTAPLASKPPMQTTN